MSDTPLASQIQQLEARIVTLEAALNAKPTSNFRQIRSSHPTNLRLEVACRIAEFASTAKLGSSASPVADKVLHLCADWLEDQSVGAGVAAARWLREEAARA